MSSAVICEAWHEVDINLRMRARGGDVEVTCKASPWLYLALGRSPDTEEIHLEQADPVVRVEPEDALTYQAPVLVILAAGMSSRYGSAKQLDPIGPGTGGETLMDYALYDARRSGFRRAVFVIRSETEAPYENWIERMALILPSDTVPQRLDDLPPGVEITTRRNKPWGTGHALLAAEGRLDGPFALINADDFYGRSSFALAWTHLTSVSPTPEPTCGFVGFRLGDTLHTPGGVSRGLCRCDGNGFLEEIREATNIRKRDGRISGSVNGAEIGLDGNEIVSMNFWAFLPAIFPLLRSEFLEFLKTRGEDPDAEFLIPEAVNRIILNGQARFKMLPAREPGFGVTSPEDKPFVQQLIRDLIDSGEYPANLLPPPSTLLPPN